MKKTTRKRTARMFPLVAALAIGLAGCAAEVTDDPEVGNEEALRDVEVLEAATPLIVGSEVAVSQGLMDWRCVKTESNGWVCRGVNNCAF